MSISGYSRCRWIKSDLWWITALLNGTFHFMYSCEHIIHFICSFREGGRVDIQAEDNGTCVPCVFHPTPRGCLKGNRCTYCHEIHAPIIPNARTRKQTREKFRRKVRGLFEAETWDEVHEELNQTARRHPYARILIQNWLTYGVRGLNDQEENDDWQMQWRTKLPTALYREMFDLLV